MAVVGGQPKKVSVSARGRGSAPSGCRERGTPVRCASSRACRIASASGSPPAPEKACARPGPARPAHVSPAAGHTLPVGSAFEDDLCTTSPGPGARGTGPGSNSHLGLAAAAAIRPYDRRRPRCSSRRGARPHSDRLRCRPAGRRPAGLRRTRQGAVAADRKRGQQRCRLPGRGTWRGEGRRTARGA
jgi:hypothetical protein